METSPDPFAGTAVLLPGGSRGIGREVALRVADGRVVVATHHRVPSSPPDHPDPDPLEADV